MMHHPNSAHFVPPRLNGDLELARPLDPDHLCVCRYIAVQEAVEDAWRDGHREGEVDASQYVIQELEQVLVDLSGTIPYYNSIKSAINGLILKLEARYPW